MQYIVIENLHMDGRRHKPGDLIDMSVEEAERLLSHGKIERVYLPFSGAAGAAPSLSDEATNVPELIGKIKSAASAIKSRIQYLDHSISDAFKRRESLMNGSMSKADFMAYVRADIARIGAKFGQEIRQMVAKKQVTYSALDWLLVERNSLFAYVTCNAVEMHAESFMEVSVSRGALFWYFGDIIAKRFEDAISALEWDDGAMPVEQRRAMVADIESEIAGYRKEREELSEQLMQTGMAG